MKKIKLAELEISSFVTEKASSQELKAGAAGPTEHREYCSFTQALRDPLCQPTGLCIPF